MYEGFHFRQVDLFCSASLNNMYGAYFKIFVINILCKLLCSHVLSLIIFQLVSEVHFTGRSLEIIKQVLIGNCKWLCFILLQILDLAV